MSEYFSHRVDISEPNIITKKQEALKAQDIPVYQLNDSNPTHHHLTLEGLPDRYDADPKGQLFARQALAEFLSLRYQNDGFDKQSTGIQAISQHVNPADLYLTSSTSQAYSWLMKLLCDPGESVLCPTPGYPLISSLSSLECIHAIPYNLHYDGTWYIDVNEIEDLLQQNTGIRALILISPNNPTGSYVDSVDYERLITLCQEYHLAIIADEVFFNFVLDPQQTPFRISGENRILTFGLDGFSKLLSAPHAKVGWIYVSGPENLVCDAKLRLDVIADDYLPMSGIVAEQIPSLLQAVPAQIQRTQHRVQQNFMLLQQLLQQSNLHLLSLLHADGGWNVLLRFPESLDENELVTYLIDTYLMTVQPGYFFDMPSNGYICISLLPEQEEFSQHVSILIHAIEHFYE